MVASDKPVVSPSTNSRATEAQIKPALEPITDQTDISDDTSFVKKSKDISHEFDTDLLLDDPTYEGLQKKLENDKSGLLTSKQLLEIYHIRVHNIKLFKQMFPGFKNYTSV